MSHEAEPPDADVLRQILAGDADLFAVLVARYQRRLYRFLLRMTGDAEDARDVAQEVFLKAYGALDSYDPRYRFSTWLFRIAGNAAIDHYRRRRPRALPLDGTEDAEDGGRKIDPEDPSPSPLEVLSQKKVRLALDAAIAKLPPDYRELISLRHYGQLAYEEIAELKEMPLGTVKNKLFRARQALRDLLPPDVV